MDLKKNKIIILFWDLDYVEKQNQIQSKVECLFELIWVLFECVNNCLKFKTEKN